MSSSQPYEIVIGLEIHVQRFVQQKQKLELRISPKTRGLIKIYPAPRGDEIVKEAAEKIRQVAEFRDRKDVARYIVENAF